MTKYFHRAVPGIAMLTVWVGIAVMPASADTLIYAQNPNYNDTIYGSQHDTNPGGTGNFTAYDNFTLGSTSDITSVTWVGGYYNPQTPGIITGFTVDFYADTAGAPGSLLYSTGDVAGNAGESFLQNDNLGDPAFLYGLDTAFVASAGTQYWLSIVPDLGFPPQWGLETSSTGDGAAYQCGFGTCGSIPSDLSFSLNTRAPLTTPEPGSVLLLVTALVALCPKVRKNWSQ